MAESSLPMGDSGLAVGNAPAADVKAVRPHIGALRAMGEE